ncbi:DUF697 domain-containing protein [Candidatus Parabeggiatoa sp. HSG14]|uniref:YcjF family protein n=1 Tax=Candidatus Parabeggiatoa sp. HSG14 TaxID=3055593 RepID=UPI0025A904C3|nr:DUF697 domain-containing protein [Thiotrichales bacterium HSG14]
MAQIKTKIDKAEEIVRKHTVGSIFVGLMPFPYVDLVVLSGIQIDMLRSLADLYNIDFSQHRGKSLLAALIGGCVPVSFSGNVFSWVKGIPIYGQLTGMASMSIFGGAATNAVGKVFIQHFESGGTFLTFEPQKVADYYAQQFEIGMVKVEKDGFGIKP